jgi:ribonucleoside-diphosphate reductase beta chain
MTYEKLLNLLGLGEEFANVKNIPCMQGRGEYLGKYLQGVYSKSDKEFTKSLILFTLLVENASLFSQFLIVSSFKKYKNLFANFNSVISATAREETIHARFGIDIINIIRKENPDWFDKDMENKIIRNVEKAFTAEVEVLDWIFEKGELDFLPKASIVEYLKYRFNDSLTKMGYEELYEVDSELIKPTEFLDVQILSTSSFDFFNEKSTDYSQNTAFNEEDIWE